MRHRKADFIPPEKTYYFLLLSENKKLTKIVSLTGNDLETTILSECNPLSFNQLLRIILAIGNGFVTC